jgi:hypothetical protein
LVLLVRKVRGAASRFACQPAAGTNDGLKRFAGGALRGAFFYGFTVMKMTDFFENQAEECRRLAAQASGKRDREYWLGLAQRWERITRQNRRAKVETIRPRTRSMVEKRFAKGRAA